MTDLQAFLEAFRNRCPNCGAEPVYRTVKHVWTTSITHRPDCPHDGVNEFHLNDFIGGDR
ncbi:hypothetical protein [Kineococcus sp. R86509]|uniref:hypothetical protein n=1 Tax=Kineococcus sp. R86509 TaxID=3093851 RepID=UPI0036D400E2